MTPIKFNRSPLQARGHLCHFTNTPMNTSAIFTSAVLPLPTNYQTFNASALLADTNHSRLLVAPSRAEMTIIPSNISKTEKTKNKK